MLQYKGRRTGKTPLERFNAVAERGKFYMRKTWGKTEFVEWRVKHNLKDLTKLPSAASLQSANFFEEQKRSL